MNLTIIGSGKIAQQLMSRLSYGDYAITIIEANADIAKYTSEHFDAMVINGSGTSLETLKKANINKSDVLIALTRSDETNILSCQMAKKCGVATTIARVRNPQFINPDFIFKSKEIGVDFFVHPEKETAESIVRLVYQASSTDIIELEQGKIQFIGLRLDTESEILHIPLAELGNRYGYLPMRIVAIKRGQFTIVPHGDDKLRHGDQFFFVCDSAFLPKALELFGKTNINIKDVMIIGGGLIGSFAASILENKFDVKVIEINSEKANKLADRLNRSLVINGDGSDLDLLSMENLMEMDELIAVTGDDETNIIISIMARHLKVPRTISLIRKKEYLALSSPLGLDAVVSKEQITANVIEKFIRRQRIAYVTNIPGVDVEITEYIANKKSLIIKKQLKDLNFSRYAILGAIYKESGIVEIPTGNSKVEAGDKVVVCALPSAMSEVEKFF